MSNPYMLPNSGRWAILMIEDGKKPRLVSEAGSFGSEDAAEDSIYAWLELHNDFNGVLWPVELPMMYYMDCGYSATGFGPDDILRHAQEAGLECSAEDAQALIDEAGSDIDVAACISGNDFIADHIHEWLENRKPAGGGKVIDDARSVDIGDIVCGSKVTATSKSQTWVEIDHPSGDRLIIPIEIVQVLCDNGEVIDGFTGVEPSHMVQMPDGTVCPAYRINPEGPVDPDVATRMDRMIEQVRKL